jgi:type IV pilus assembly protein PilW
MRARVASGFTLVELMVGMAIGLAVLAGALALLANVSAESRRLLRETRLNQDLRAAMDLVTRDLRRAGHWQGATAGIASPGGANRPPRNAYHGFYASACNASALGASAPAPAAAAAFVCYDVAQDADNMVQNHEHFGFHVASGVLYAVLAGGSQQALTDASVMTVSHFVVSPSSQAVATGGFCVATCTSNCPRVVVREFEVTLKAHVTGDPTIQRQLRSNVRVRNDYHDGQCPAA